MKQRSIIKPDPNLQNNLMAFGFDCGEVWYPLIEETLDKIEKELENYPELKNDFEITQIKEKFGMLVIYTSFITDEIEKIIDEAENKSMTICEVCGESGELRERNHWLVTLCDKHFEERNK